MTWRHWTGLVIVLFIVGLIVYDCVALAMAGANATITHVIQDALPGYPIIAFAAGVVCGHLFWPAAKDE